jgi:hypothetical protein
MAIPGEVLEQLAVRFEVLLPHLNERQQRLALAAEARLLGHGGVRAVARAAGVSETTVRKLLYTTNGIESLNYQLRKVTKARGHFPTDDAVVKLLWLAIVNIEDKRARERAARARQDGIRSGYPARLIEGQKTYGWSEALNELADAYPDRIQ